MLCTNCGKSPAKTYIKKTEGRETKLFLCPACYAKLYTERQDDFFTSFMGNVGREQKSCPACGTTLEDFKNTGLLGCAHCYTAFREELTPTVRYVHQGGVRHEGKSPSADAEENYDIVRELVREQEEIKEQYDLAVREQDFARAETLKARLIEINRKLHRGA